MKLLAYTITPNYPQFPVKEKTIVNTINLYCYCEAIKDEIFNKGSQSLDILFPDRIQNKSLLKYVQ